MKEMTTFKVIAYPKNGAAEARKWEFSSKERADGFAVALRVQGYFVQQETLGTLPANGFLGGVL